MQIVLLAAALIAAALAAPARAQVTETPSSSCLAKHFNECATTKNAEDKVKT